MIRAKGRDGFILVAVLGVLALLASLAGGTALLVRSAFNGVHGAADDLKLEALITAGVELAAYELFELKLPVARLASQQVRLDDGTITLSAADESGRIDLNWSDPALLAGAYRAAGLTTLQPSDFAARVVRWRERDQPPPSTNPTGISLAAPRIGQGKDGFRTIAELRWLPDVSQEDAAALAPLVTVANVQGKVNASEAPTGVLLALPEMTTALAAQVVALRAVRTPAAAERIKDMLQKQQIYLTTTRGASFRIRVEVETGPSARRDVEVTLTRGPTREAPYFVTAWQR